MEIKVYTDGSKIKNKVIAGLTVRQAIGFGAIILMLVIFLLNDFVVHLPDTVVQPLLVFITMPVLFASLFKIKGMPADHWFRLRMKFYFTIKKRVYQTERIKLYKRFEFKQDKKIKETDSL
ncbi:MAG: PrgI family protein [Streptococcaceae bacterium]|jgi:hypothetical protein|nr:PrgI family protein [Streptococcaceae bacterium]